MKTTLPANFSAKKRKELTRIVEHILGEKKFLVMQVVLYGSYATGKHVDYDLQKQKDGIETVYQSDYDILVILAKKKDAQKHFPKNRIANKIFNDSDINTPVELIYEFQGDIKKHLGNRRSFFIDINTQGVSLFSRGNFSLDISGENELSQKEKLTLSKEYFEEYFLKINQHIQMATLAFQNNLYNHSAFHLHQTIEKLFHCLLLVYAHYTPKEHNLKKLLEYWIPKHINKTIVEDIKKVFPRDTREEKNLFTLLVQSYVDSRYKKDFSISSEQIQQLFMRITHIKNIIEKASHAHIQRLQ